MSLEKHRLEHPEQRYGNCKFTRRTRFGIGLVALVGIGLIAGMLIGTSMSVSAHPDFGGWGRHGGAVTIEDISSKGSMPGLAGNVHVAPTPAAFASMTCSHPMPG